MESPVVELTPREEATKAAKRLGSIGGRNGSRADKRKAQLASAAARKANRLARLSGGLKTL